MPSHVNYTTSMSIKPLQNALQLFTTSPNLISVSCIGVKTTGQRIYKNNQIHMPKKDKARTRYEILCEVQPFIQRKRIKQKINLHTKNRIQQ